MAKKRSTIIDIHRAKKAKSSRFLIAAFLCSGGWISNCVCGGGVYIGKEQ